MQAIDAVGAEDVKGEAFEEVPGRAVVGLTRQAQAVSRLQGQERLAQERRRLAQRLREAFPDFQEALEELSGGEKE